MRIAYVLGLFPTLSETFVGNEMRALEALGHTVFPIALHHTDGIFQEADADLAARTLYFCSMDQATASSLRRLYRFRKHRARTFLRQQTTENPDHLFLHAAHCAEHIRSNRCTHIHAHFAWGATSYAIVAAQLLGLPVSFTCHGSDVYARPQDLALKCAMADVVVAVAPTLGHDLIQRYPSAKIATIACGVDADYFRPAATQVSRHARWLFVGRLVDCKGATDLIKAWGMMPDHMRPQLDIVGDGPLLTLLQELVSQYDLHAYIHFLGAQSSKWIAEHGPHYRAFICPFREGSDGARDTSPVVLKEAMAMGLPIVTTRFIDVPYLVAEAAILVPSAEPGALISAVENLNRMTPCELLAIGQAGRERVIAQFTLHNQAQSLITLFNQCSKQ